MTSNQRTKDCPVSQNAFILDIKELHPSWRRNGHFTCLSSYQLLQFKNPKHYDDYDS